MRRKQGRTIPFHSQSRRRSRGGRRMSNRATNPMALRAFRASLHGELILPDDDGYDSSLRVWNGMIDKYPATIIRCANRSDGAHAVQFWALQHLPVAFRPDVHSVIRNSVC